MKKTTRSSQPVTDDYIRETKNAVMLDLGKKVSFGDIRTNQQVRSWDSDYLLEFLISNRTLLSSIYRYSGHLTSVRVMLWFSGKSTE